MTYARGIPVIPCILPRRTTISRNALAADCVSRVIAGVLGVFRSWRLSFKVFWFFRILTSSQVISVQSLIDRQVRHMCLAQKAKSLKQRQRQLRDLVANGCPSRLFDGTAGLLDGVIIKFSKGVKSSDQLPLRC